LQQWKLLLENYISLSTAAYSQFLGATRWFKTMANQPELWQMFMLRTKNGSYKYINKDVRYLPRAQKEDLANLLRVWVISSFFHASVILVINITIFYSLSFVIYKMRLGIDNWFHIYCKMYHFFCIQQASWLRICRKQNKCEIETHSWRFNWLWILNTLQHKDLWESSFHCRKLCQRVKR
jgi:hypothetical protein